MRIRGLWWYLGSVVVAIIPIGALAIQFWRHVHHTWPSLDQLLSTGDAFLVAIAITGQGIIDAWRLATGEHVEPRPKRCGILVGLLSTLAALAESALWAVVVFTPSEQDSSATAHTSEFFLGIAIVLGGL